MAGPGTTFSGPVISGTKKDADGNGAANTGLCLLTQAATITQNGTNAVTVEFVLPVGSILHEIVADTTAAWNSATSADLTVGTAAGDSTYAGGGTEGSVKTAGRINSVAGSWISATQLAAWQTVATTVYATVTPTGATTAGTTTVTIEYIQTVQLTAGTE